MEPTLIILNPAAKSERAGAFLQQISKLTGDYLVRTTSGPGQARQFAEEGVRAGFRRVVVAGGDGTINEVVNGLAESEVELGLLPIGTMNVFATELGIPCNDFRKAWEIVLAGNAIEIDLSKANERYFVQMGGVGFDAQIVQETTLDSKNALGPLSYLLMAAQIAARKPPRLVVEAEGKSWEGSFVLVGNGRYYGGPFVLFKQAKFDDGLLDVLIFKKPGFS